MSTCILNQLNRAHVYIYAMAFLDSYLWGKNLEAQVRMWTHFELLDVGDE